MGVYANSLSKRPAITVREVTKLPSTRIFASSPMLTRSPMGRGIRTTCTAVIER